MKHVLIILLFLAVAVPSLAGQKYLSWEFDQSDMGDVIFIVYSMSDESDVKTKLYETDGLKYFLPDDLPYPLRLYVTAKNIKGESAMSPYCTYLPFPPGEPSGFGIRGAETDTTPPAKPTGLSVQIVMTAALNLMIDEGY